MLPLGAPSDAKWRWCKGVNFMLFFVRRFVAPRSRDEAIDKEPSCICFLLHIGFHHGVLCCVVLRITIAVSSDYLDNFRVLHAGTCFVVPSTYGL
jgi:hypothetical protein